MTISLETKQHRFFSESSLFPEGVEPMIRAMMSCLIVATATIAVSSADGAIIGFEAESGTLGASMGTDTEAAALGGIYITTSVNGSGESPAAATITTYPVALPAGTFDLWARVYVENASPPQVNAHSSNLGDGYAANDSFFMWDDLTTTPATPNDTKWVRRNDLQNFDGTDGPSDVTGNEIARGAWAWFNVSDWTSNSDPVTTYSGSGTFAIGGREDGLRIDAFAFVTDGTVPTEAELDASVAVAATPEPSSFALALFSVVGLAALRRRRKSA